MKQVHMSKADLQSEIDDLECQLSEVDKLKEHLALAAARERELDATNAKLWQELTELRKSVGAAETNTPVVVHRHPDEVESVKIEQNSRGFNVAVKAQTVERALELYRQTRLELNTAGAEK